MIIFIDESGDAGFKIEKGSSKTFVVSLVIFDDELDAEETALKIKKFRRSIKKPDYFEFKFNKCNKEIKIGFLKTVCNSKFRVRSIVVQKEKIYSHTLRRSKDKFYSYIIKEVLKNNNDTIKNAKIKLDGLGERAFRRSLQTYLRKHLNADNKPIINNLRFCDSRTNVLIQLADMVTGAINRSYNSDRTDQKEYKKIIDKRIEDIWEFQ